MVANIPSMLPVGPTSTWYGKNIELPKLPIIPDPR